MTSCPKCGRSLDPDARFCQVCGSEVSGEQVRTVLTGTATPDPDVATVLTPSPYQQADEDPLLDKLRRATIGQYEVLLELGRGGMAAVYLAHDLALDRKVAIKVMFPETLGSEGAAERFRREARTSASLNHPNIIPIYTVSEKSDLLYFVMQFIAGRPLDDVIREASPLPIRLVQTILHHVGSALAYAHRRGVVHRDIKPSNIMLDEDGWAIVTDFGIAKVSDSQSITRTGSAIGTPTYMSPEQCSARDVGGASDQYALGVMAFEMLTGAPPFDGDNAMAIMYKHVSDAPPLLVEKRSDCPKGLADAVHRMLEKDPDDRFESLEVALAEIGSVPAEESEEVRTEIVGLAKTALTREALARIRTPQSPMPSTVARPATPAAAAGPAGPSVRSKKRWPLVAALLVFLVGAPVAIWWSGVLSGNPPAAAIEPSAEPRPASGSTMPESMPVDAIDISGSSGELIIGQSVQLSGVALDANGNAIPEIVAEWSSSNPAVADVSSAGVVTARSAGSVLITARYENHSTTLSVAVTAPPPPTARPNRPAAPAPVASVVILPGSAQLTIGESLRLAIELRDAQGNVLSGRSVTWVSSRDGVARVGPDGTVTAVAEGTATITATSENVNRQADVTVAEVSVARLDIAPSGGSLAPGETLRLTASTFDARNRRLSGRPVSWRSSNDNVARVSATGNVTAVGPGTATITAESAPVTATARIDVTEPVREPTTPAQPDPAAVRAEVEGAIEEYRLALESRNIDRVRAIAPGLTSAQQQAWEQFFRDANRISVNFAVGAVDVQGSTATASVTGTIRFGGDPTDSRFRATLERRGSRWVITAVQ